MYSTDIRKNGSFANAWNPASSRLDHSSSQASISFQNLLFFLSDDFDVTVRLILKFSCALDNGNYCQLTPVSVVFGSRRLCAKG